MPEGVLRILEYCFLALIYLFLFRIVRTVLAELRPSKVPVLLTRPPARWPTPRADARSPPSTSS